MWYNQFQMTRVLFLALTIIFFVPSATYAQSSANIKVENSVESSSQNETNVKTDIRVETNGNVTTYSSDKPENIEINAVNGQSEIKVNGQVLSGEESLSTKSPSIKSAVEPEDIESKKEEVKNKNIIEVIGDVIKGLFSLLI